MKAWLQELLAIDATTVWALHIFAILVATGLLAVLSKWLLKRLEARIKNTKNEWDDVLVASIRRPVRLVIWVIGLSLAAEIAFADATTGLQDYTAPARQMGVLVGFAWFGLRFIGQLEMRLNARTQQAEMSLDATTISAISKLLKIAVMLTTLLIGMQTLGFSISGVLAAGGVGGLAVGFAAKDMLANFFGALMIYLDKPFKVGEWIRSPDKEIEGTVEDIGWRATRIRTFDQRPLYVPNAVFSSISVENPSRMLNRRIKETIGVRYDDIEQVHAITVQIETMLQKHPDIDTKKTLFVKLDSFGASSVDILVYTFTKTVEWVPYHGIKQDVLLKIADIIANHGAEIAFPTRTLHMVQQAEAETQ